MTKLLFVCSQNRLRSPTAERIFSGNAGLEVASAGLNRDAEKVLDAETVEWADIIFVMERSHLNRLRKQFKEHLKKARVVCLHIPDEYEFMDPTLVQLLEARVAQHLRAKAFHRTGEPPP